MGGAAAVLGAHGPLPVDALLEEALYPSIEEAVAHRLRLRLGAWRRRPSALCTWQLPARLGIRSQALRPSGTVRSKRRS